MLTLIENGEVYAPEPVGQVPILLANEKILKVGDIDAAAVRSLGVAFEVIDAGGCYVLPGFIDPHEHLLGGSGEESFATQTPEIAASEIATAGITTVVGCLGADTTMKTLAGLLAKVKGLKEEGLNAYMWSGGYNMPPRSITSTLRDDVMFIEEVIGAGEIAVADRRSSDPTSQELARVVHEVYVGGTLSGKAGVTHIHVGEAEEGLALLRDLIEKHNVAPEWLYATHISRSEKLMKEAIELAKNGSWVDIDTVDETLPECLRFYMEHTGWEEKLTVSSDASITSPHNLYNQIRACVLDEGIALERVLPFVTSNTAAALKLPHKGRIREGMAADVLVADRETMDLREVISLGRRLVKNGELAFTERFLKDSNRSVILNGRKSTETTSNRPAHFARVTTRATYIESYCCEGK